MTAKSCLTSRRPSLHILYILTVNGFGWEIFFLDGVGGMRMRDVHIRRIGCHPHQNIIIQDHNFYVVS